MNLFTFNKKAKVQDAVRQLKKYNFVVSQDRYKELSENWIIEDPKGWAKIFNTDELLIFAAKVELIEEESLSLGEGDLPCA